MLTSSIWRYSADCEFKHDRKAFNHICTLLTLVPRPNSRKLQFSQGIKIFGGGEHFGMNTLARARRQAVKERWNVPEVSSHPLRTLLWGVSVDGAHRCVRFVRLKSPLRLR